MEGLKGMDGMKEAVRVTSSYKTVPVNPSTVNVDVVRVEESIGSENVAVIVGKYVSGSVDRGISLT